jgi:outer membrane protein TolC
MTGYQVTRDNLATLNTLAESQQKQYAAIQAQAQAGAADNLDLFNSQIELATGELVLWDARVKVQQARGELEDALQRPIESMTHALAQGPPPVASAQSVHPTPSTQP